MFDVILLLSGGCRN